MAAAPLIMMGAGTIMEGFGAIKGAEADAQAGEFNARVSERNAKLARLQAAEDERVHRVMTRKAIGQMRAGYGASGVSADSASALDVLGESARNAELDAMKIKQAGEFAAQGHQMDAYGARMGAKAAMSAGHFKAASSLLSGASGFLKRSS